VAHLQQVAWLQSDIPEHPVAAMRELIEGSGFPQGVLLAPMQSRQRCVGPAHQAAEHSSTQRARPPDIGSVVSARKHVDLLEVAVSNRNAASLGAQGMRLTSARKRWVSVAWKTSRRRCYTPETIA
jgi:hypothetical protein